METRTFLQVKQPENKYQDLFVGEDCLVRFWLLLSDLEAIEKARPTFRKVFLNKNPKFNKYDIDSGLKIDKTQIMAMAAERRIYVEKVYSHKLLRFYDEWIAYLKYEESFDNVFYADIIQLEESYAHPNKLLYKLKEILLKIEGHDPTFEPGPAETSG